MRARRWLSLLSVGAILLVGLLAGCAQLEYTKNGDFLYTHKELVAADQAVEAARAAGKNRECPNEFNAAEKLKKDAFAVYKACRTNEAIAMANDASAKAAALCPAKAALPLPAAPTAKAAKPTVVFNANPGTIQAGKCTTLTWAATNATSAVIDQGVGAVPTSGSKEVCPKTSLGYGITAKGPGGSATEAAVVIVNPAPKAAAPTVTLAANPRTIQAGKCSTLSWTSTNATGATIDQGVGAVPANGSKEVCPKMSMGYQISAKGPGGSGNATTVVLVEQPAPKPAYLTLHINFDSSKATIRQADIPELQKAIEFVKQHPDRKISVQGHTDNRGGTKLNQGLSEKRAAAVKEYIVKHGGVGGDRISAKGFGESKPVANNSTAAGRLLNRRVEVIAE